MPQNLLSAKVARGCGWIWVEGLRVLQPTSQPITLISSKIWFSFKSLFLQGGRGERGKEAREMGGGLIYLNNLVVMKAAWAHWRWKDG